ncbi:MAG: hypothetical protein AB9M53_01130 [Leptothrix sp. (in: b-proteobacteria)]
MNRDRLIEFAIEAGMEVHERKGQIRIGSDVLGGCDSTYQVERFAELVAAAARAEEHAKMQAGIQMLSTQLAAKQAKIDRLMLEHCPDEMTPEQLATWAAHQRVHPAESDSEGGAPD